jgi:hypothetical protein
MNSSQVEQLMRWFVSYCEHQSIAPSIAFENPQVRAALKTGNKALVIAAIAEEF